MQSFWPDLAAQNEAISFSSWSSIHKLTGEIVSGPNQFQFTAATEGDAAPPRIYRHNRPKFLRMLIMLLEKVGISIEYGNRVVEYYEDSEKSGIVLADGRRMEADVVVAADGIGTKSHQLINGRDIRAWSSGLAIFRTAFPVDVIVADEEINRHFSILDNGSPGLQIWMGSVNACQSIP